MNEQLYKLFKLWYKTQCLNDNDENSSFICDGSLSHDNLIQHDILFVCRESHDKADKFKEDFWLKNVVYGLANNGQKYYNCIRLIINYLNSIQQENFFEIKKCAYININKKGGASTCNFKNLNEYAKQYKYFITKEIEILNPQNIVILGKLNRAKDAEKIFIEYGQKYNIKVYIYDRHPSFYSKYINNHIYIYNN